MDDKRAALYQSAKELFSEKGLKGTGVQDITRRAGVAVGTFYLYYPSKDRLFIEIFKDENAAMLRRAMEGIDPDGEPREIILSLIERNARGMMDSPILRQWYDPDAAPRIERLFRKEDGLGAMAFLYQHFLELVRAWQRKGRMRPDIDARMIMAMFEAILRIGHRREEIGPEFFPALQEYLTGFVLDGLTRAGR